MAAFYRVTKEIMTRKHYEILFILRPIQEERLDNIVENYRATITQDGTIHRFENCGLHQFAYAIQDLRRGYYILMNVECSIAKIEELEKTLRTDENVLRFLLIKRRKSISEPSPLKKRRASDSSLSSDGAKTRKRERDGEEGAKAKAAEKAAALKSESKSPEGESSASEGESESPEAESPASEGESESPEAESSASEDGSESPETESPVSEGESESPETESPVSEDESESTETDDDATKDKSGSAEPDDTTEKENKTEAEERKEDK